MRDAEEITDDPFIERIAAELRADVPLAERVAQRIMAASRVTSAVREHQATRRRVRRWSWATAAVVTVGVGATFTVLRLAPRSPMTLPAVQFSLPPTAAREVVVVGDFNHWDATATPLQRSRADGSWRTTVRLAPGRHIYAFVVDGEHWVADPAAPLAPGDDFGAPNSLMTVAPGAI